MYAEGSAQGPPMRVHHEHVLRYGPPAIMVGGQPQLSPDEMRVRMTRDSGFSSSQPFPPDGAAGRRPYDPSYLLGTLPKDMNAYGQSMEYAAGTMLREKVLDPVLKEMDQSSEEQAEATRFLCIYGRGELLFLKRADGYIHQASIDHMTMQDSPVIASWWEADKTLSYASMVWSDWWVSRCHALDRGCEMIKLVSETGEILGVAYFERSIIDNHDWGEENRTITLIRGIRLNPQLNREVHRRGSLFSGAHNTFEPDYKGISSMLFCYIMFASIRYGSRGVGVNCPKNEVAEKFYESFMGPPQAFHQDTGRRYYRIDSGQRWKILQQGFRRQVEFWTEQRAREANGETSNGPLTGGDGGDEPTKAEKSTDKTSSKRQKADRVVADVGESAIV